MIVAVTGPSAAGKTTWCQTHYASDVVAEYEPSGAEPGGDDLAAQADFWSDVNCQRWRAAIGQERVSGLAVCDDDPMKLHYVWSLVRIGVADPGRFAEELRANRLAVAQRRLGFADLVLVSLPPLAELRRRREADLIRRRRNFELHVRLSEPLREWYEALARVDPRRVRWGLPPGGLPEDLPASRSERYDVTLFDALIGELPTT